MTAVTLPAGFSYRDGAGYYKDTDGSGPYVFDGTTMTLMTSAGGGTATAVTITDGGDVAIGAKADTAATTDTGTFSLIALFKRLLGKIAGTSTTGTEANVAGAATDGTILASNASRKGATVYNDSTAILYLLVGTGTSSATVHTVQLPQGSYYEVPSWYTGVVKGIWASATGSARVTEFT